MNSLLRTLWHPYSCTDLILRHLIPIPSLLSSEGVQENMVLIFLGFVVWHKFINWPETARIHFLCKNVDHASEMSKMFFLVPFVWVVESQLKLLYSLFKLLAVNGIRRPSRDSKKSVISIVNKIFHLIFSYMVLTRGFTLFTKHDHEAFIDLKILNLKYRPK